MGLISPQFTQTVTQFNLIGPEWVLVSKAFGGFPGKFSR